MANEREARVVEPAAVGDAIHNAALKGFKAGEYQNASEAVGDALRALQRRSEDALKLRPLRLNVRAGVDALDRREFAEVDESKLDRYLERVAVESDNDPN